MGSMIKFPFTLAVFIFGCSTTVRDYEYMQDANHDPYANGSTSSVNMTPTEEELEEEQKVRDGHDSDLPEECTPDILSSIAIGLTAASDSTNTRIVLNEQERRCRMAIVARDSNRSFDLEKERLELERQRLQLERESSRWKSENRTENNMRVNIKYDDNEYQFNLTGHDPVAVESICKIIKENAPSAKSRSNIYLVDVGPTKINVIKTLRTITHIGLKEAKDLVEAHNSLLAENVSSDDVDMWRREFRKAGATLRVETYVG